MTKNQSSKSANVLFYILLTYTLLLVWPIPYQATFPDPEAAWGYALNYFLHSRYVFGPDLVFTYGPLGFLNNPQHVAHDIEVALLVHLFFWIALAMQLSAIWHQARHTAAVVFCLALISGHNLYNDYWDYSLLALSIITLFKLFRGSPSLVDYFLLPLLLGISFLLKVTAFTMVALMFGLYAIHSARQGSMSRRQIAWLSACVLSIPAAYLLYSFSLPNMITYVKGSVQIATGFSTSMSIDPPKKELGLAMIVAGLVLLNSLIGLWTRRSQWGESFLILFILWTVFRHGFVRGDTAHMAVYFCFCPLLFACLFFGWNENFWSRQKVGRMPEWVLALSWLILIALCIPGINSRYPVFSSANFSPMRAFNDLKTFSDRANLFYGLDHMGDPSFAHQPGIAFRDQIEGKRVMIFPNSTPYVAKLNFEMFPIYGLQEYSNHTSYLDRRNAQGLYNASPPVDKVMMNWYSIDGRNPLLDTPSSVLALFSKFQFESRAPEALLLTRRSAKLDLHLLPLDHQPFKPDEWVQVPQRGELVAMSIDLKQSLAGKLRTVLFDQDAVYLGLETRSGEKLQYRVPPLPLRNPGIISFVPRSLNEIEQLWKQRGAKNDVIKLRLFGPGLRWAVSKGYDFFAVQGS